MIGNLSTSAARTLLQTNVLGRIGCTDAKKTYVVPVNYVYDGTSIIGHSVEGLKIRMMRKNPRVCFEVDEMKSLRNWKSVIAWGNYQELTNERDRYEAMKLFVDRMMYLKISQTATPPEVSENRVHSHTRGNIKPVIYRIVIEEMSGRFENE